MQHIEVPRLEVESELQLSATATATQDRSHVCCLCHSSRQQQILNPPSEARNQTQRFSRILVRFVTAAPQRELLYQDS